MSDVGDQLLAAVQVSASVTMRTQVSDDLVARGVFVMECIGPDGELKWAEVFDNTVVTTGKNVMLDQALAGSAYTVTGPYMGLISSTSYSAISAADTMASHAGWLEAGNANTPTYTSPRKTCAWSAASAGAKALSSALSFAITGNGTIKGVFLTFFTGAVTTIDNTSGTLLSAGLFTAGDRLVQIGDTVNVSYSMSL